MENWGQIFETLLFWFGTVVAAASIIVKATPTQKDDAILAKVVKVLNVLSIVNAKINDGKQTNVWCRFNRSSCPADWRNGFRFSSGTAKGKK